LKKSILGNKPLLLRLVECCSPKKKRHRKVNETPMRSFIKTMGFRIVEILLDTLILQIISENTALNLVVSIMIEGLCWLLSFIWERIWNRIDFGREIKAKCPHCDKEMEMCAECTTIKKRKPQKPR
jgi:uncharacterized membrane protein